MKALLLILLTMSFSIHASPFMSTKERLRTLLWTEGLEEKPKSSETKKAKRTLPEELERALQKL